MHSVMRCAPPPGLEMSSPWPARNFPLSDRLQEWGLPDHSQRVVPSKFPQDMDDMLPKKVLLSPTSYGGVGLSDIAPGKATLAYQNACSQRALLMHLESEKQKALDQMWRQTQPQGPTTWMEPGTMVFFHGLQKAPALNGKCGVLEGWDAGSNRWKIRMPDGEQKFAKKENVTMVPPMPAMPATPGFIQDFDSGRLPPGLGQHCTSLASLADLLTATRHHGKHGGQEATANASTCSILSLELTTAPSSVHSSLCCSRSDSTCDVMQEDMSETQTTASSAALTTIMMRNIPSEYTGLMLLTLLNKNGFNGSYDLVYLPMDYHNRVGFGYAFINFVSPEAAQNFRLVFEGFSDWGMASDKVCEVCWSNVLQGVEAHIERYRNSPVMHEAVPDAFKPMLFAAGKRVPFPAPMKSIRPPRLRKKCIKL